MTSWSAASTKYRQYLERLFNTTDINTVVIDLKDSSGIIFYDTQAAKAHEYKNFRTDLIDLKNFTNYLHNKGIYIIARLNIFNDSALVKDRSDLALYSKSKSTFAKIPWRNSSKILI